jgi:arylsulfatase A-like enzyme
VLFVFADQWRRQAVGFRNEDPVITPNIDNFAADSLVLDQAISCFPLCSPNRSTMMTGRFPLSTGVTTNCKTGLPVRMKPDEIGIGSLLKDAGYETGYIGKWHLDLPEQNVTPEPASGARGWDAYTPPGPARYGFDFWYSYGAYDNHMAPHYWKDSPEMIRVSDWSLAHETDVAIDYIQRRDRSKPFALYVSWNPPHQPFHMVPEKYLQMYDDDSLVLRPNVTGEGRQQAEKHLQQYYAAVTGMDDQFGRLLQALRDEGIADDTIVVLTSDHGETMGAHGWLEHKNIWYEESIGIPFFVRWPGTLRTGREDVLFNSADMVPTLLGLLGIPVPERIEGRNLSDVFMGRDADKPNSTFICHYPGSVKEHETARDRGLDIHAYGWRGVRTPDYTYVVDKPFGAGRAKRLLYDNGNDPYQMNPRQIEDVRTDPVALELERQLQGWLRKINDPFILPNGNDNLEE